MEDHLVGGEHFRAEGEPVVACVLCQDSMFTSPVSLQCGHYFCWECLHVSYERSMKTNLNCHRQAYTENLSEAKECPTCVRALGKGSKPPVTEKGVPPRGLHGPDF